jgi:hypothetical protein
MSPAEAIRQAAITRYGEARSAWNGVETIGQLIQPPAVAEKALWSGMPPKGEYRSLMGQGGGFFQASTLWGRLRSLAGSLDGKFLRGRRSDRSCQV